MLILWLVRDQYVTAVLGFGSFRVDLLNFFRFRSVDRFQWLFFQTFTFEGTIFPPQLLESVALEFMLCQELFMDAFLLDDGDFIFSDVFFQKMVVIFS